MSSLQNSQHIGGKQHIESFPVAPGVNTSRLVQDPGINIPLPAITNTALTTNVATITTATAHGLQIGDQVLVAAVTQTALNGTFFVVSVPTATTFTYALTHADIGTGADTGTVNKVGGAALRDMGGLGVGSGFNQFLAQLVAHTLVGTGLTEFKIVANTANDGSGTEVTVKTHAIPTAPDTVGNYLNLECTAEEVRQANTDAAIPITALARYVGVRFTMANAGDKGVCVYVTAQHRSSVPNLTADQVVDQS